MTADRSQTRHSPTIIPLFSFPFLLRHILSQRHTHNMQSVEEEQVSSFELRPQRQTQDAENIDPAGLPAQELKPVDKGRDAWTVLIAASYLKLFSGVLELAIPSDTLNSLANSD